MDMQQLLCCQLRSSNLRDITLVCRQKNSSRRQDNGRQGRIDGMIFLASCLCDLGLEAVEWTRAWIADVGNQLM